MDRLPFPRAVIGLLSLSVVSPVLTSCRPEPRVLIERLVVVNPTPYRLDVELSDANSDGGVPLGTVQPHGDATFRNVAEPRELWIFVFLHAGQEVDAVALRQKQLARRHWRITVPMRVEEHLRALGTPPSAAERRTGPGPAESGSTGG